MCPRTASALRWRCWPFSCSIHHSRGDFRTGRKTFHVPGECLISGWFIWTELTKLTELLGRRGGMGIMEVMRLLWGCRVLAGDTAGGQPALPRKFLPRMEHGSHRSIPGPKSSEITPSKLVSFCLHSKNLLLNSRRQSRKILVISLPEYAMLIAG